MITPYHISANGLWNIFSGKKKWTVTCGNCHYTWSDKLPIVEDITAICPHCKKLNGWSASAFQRMYNENLAMRKRQK